MPSLMCSPNHPFRGRHRSGSATVAPIRGLDTAPVPEKRKQVTGEKTKAIFRFAIAANRNVETDGSMFQLSEQSARMYRRG
jgi:hypothetical protein